MSNTIPGISRFSQGILLAQHRIEGLILEDLVGYSNVDIQRNVEPRSIAYNHSEAEKQSDHPVTVRKAHVGCRNTVNPVTKTTSKEVVETSGQSKKRNLNGFYKHPVTEEVIRAKYVIGCDGVYSWTRAQLDFQMEGEQSDYIWGVLGELYARSYKTVSLITKADYPFSLDVVAITNFRMIAVLSLSRVRCLLIR